MIMTACLSRGLVLSDFDNLTIGQAVDYIVTYNESLENKSVIEDTSEERDASRLDFELF